MVLSEVLRHKVWTDIQTMANKSVHGVEFWEVLNMAIHFQPFFLVFAEQVVCLGYGAIVAIGYWKESVIPSVRKRWERWFYNIVHVWLSMISAMVRKPIATRLLMRSDKLSVQSGNLITWTAIHGAWHHMPNRFWTTIVAGLLLIRSPTLGGVGQTSFPSMLTLLHRRSLWNSVQRTLTWKLNSVIVRKTGKHTIASPSIVEKWNLTSLTVRPMRLSSVLSLIQIISTMTAMENGNALIIGTIVFDWTMDAWQ